MQTKKIKSISIMLLFILFFSVPINLSCTSETKEETTVEGKMKDSQNDGYLSSMKQVIKDGEETSKNGISWVYSKFKSTEDSDKKIVPGQENNASKSKKAGAEATAQPIAKQSKPIIATDNQITKKASPNQNEDSSIIDKNKLGSLTKEYGGKLWSGVKTTLLFLAKIGLIVMIVAFLYLAPLITIYYFFIITWVGDFSYMSTLGQLITIICFIIISIIEYYASKLTEGAMAKKIISAIIIYIGHVLFFAGILSMGAFFTALVHSLLFFFFGYIIVALVLFGSLIFSATSVIVSLGLMNSSQGYFTGDPTLTLWHYLWLTLLVVFSLKTLADIGNRE